MSPDTERLVALGRHIRRLRRERDLSQEELAHRAHIHRNHVGSIEHGATTAGVLTLLNIADALGVAPAVLFTPFPAKEDQPD